MKAFGLILVLVASLFMMSAKKNSKTLNGTWIPIRQEMNGESMPALLFANQKLILKDKEYSYIAESVDRGEISYQGGHMDIYGKEGVNAGKHFTALYTYKKGILTICYNLMGDGYPENFETKNLPTRFVSVFKRISRK